MLGGEESTPAASRGHVLSQGLVGLAMVQRDASSPKERGGNGLATATPIGDPMVVPVMSFEAPRCAVAKGVATLMGLHKVFAMLALGIAHLVTVLCHALALLQASLTLARGRVEPSTFGALGI